MDKVVAGTQLSLPLSHHHGDQPVRVSDLAEAVVAVADPNGRGRQYLAREIGKHAGTRLAGFFLERIEPGNSRRKEGVRYRLTRLGSDQNPSALSASSASTESSAPQDQLPDATCPDTDRQISRRADDADDAGAFQPKPNACASCGGGGELLPVSRSGKTAVLHYDCIPAWESDRHGS